MARLKRLIAKAESWQIFFVFVGVILLYGIVPQAQQELKIVVSIFLALVIFGWFLMLGTSLNENLPEEEQKPDTLFVVSCFYGTLIVSASAILKDVPMDESLMEYAVIVVVSFGLSTFYIIYFVSTLFSSNQEHFPVKEKLSAGLIFVLFVGFILGVLILQPRIRSFFRQTS